MIRHQMQIKPDSRERNSDSDFNQQKLLTKENLEILNKTITATDRAITSKQSNEALLGNH